MNAGADSSPTFLCVGVTPGIQQTRVIPTLERGRIHRVQQPVREQASGKAVNTARVLRTFGAAARNYGFVGGARGRQVCRLLDEEGMVHHFTEVPAETRTCITLVDPETTTEIIDPFDVPDARAWDALEAAVAEDLPDAAGLIIAGKMLPGGPDEFYARLVRRARDAGVFSIVDSQGPALVAAAEAGVSICKLNKHELVATMSLASASPEALKEGAAALLKAGAGQVLVTCGADGAWTLGPGGHKEIGAPRIQARNPIGSGDSVTAGLALGLADGQSVADALALAMGCGAANAASEAIAVIDPAYARELAATVQGHRI